MAKYFEETITDFSIKERLKSRRDVLEISNGFLASWAKISPTTLSKALSGTEDLDHAIATQLLEDLLFAIEVKDALKPFALPLRDADETKRLLDNLRNWGVTPERIREAIGTLLPVDE